MTSLVMAHRRSEGVGEPVEPHLQYLPGGLAVLVGPCSAEAARTLDRELGQVPSRLFPPNLDVMVDCGRVLADASGQVAMLNASDRILILSRADPGGLSQVERLLAAMCDSSPRARTSLVLIDPIPFDIADVENALGVEILPTLPTDHKAAAIVCGSPGDRRTLARSKLVSAARRIADRLITTMEGDSEIEEAGGPKMDVGPRFRGEAGPLPRWASACSNGHKGRVE
jgi:hypothetical protein